MTRPVTAEARRLEEERERRANWSRWGTYLAERQWGTVREDYSEGGTCWDYFSHDHARSRAYRWGEDGLFGLCDRQGRLCFAFAFWNEQDPILKERLFGLTGPEGNHGEDVKECYYYLDATPTTSYAKALYKYPQRAFPYQELIEDNRRRARNERELELTDTGVLDDRYFDLTFEYAKAAPDDVLVRLTIENHGPDTARLHVLPTLWFRNTWSWGREGEGYWPKPSIVRAGDALVTAHASLDAMRLDVEAPGELLFTENESNGAKLWGLPPGGPSKDAFHDFVIHGQREALAREERGTKAARHVVVEVPPGGKVVLRARLSAVSTGAGPRFDESFDRVVAERAAEADEFYGERIGHHKDGPDHAVARQAYAGLIWSRQFYYYVVQHWLDGDPAQPAPPARRLEGRNHEWRHLYNRDVLSMPDKWEYPWYAAWDLAFHMVPYASIDPDFAKSQLVLMLREWYLHPNGQIPAYEFALGDVNPPVHAWAAWRVYLAEKRAGRPDREFLARVFQKLILNFTWWVNRKDADGKNLFSGGFLGLDNIGVFDRSQALPTGGHLEQADGTAWMAFYCSTLLAMALELAEHDRVYEDLASKFFEHFVAIVDAMNGLGGTGLWDDEDGFYYDELHVNGSEIPLRTRSMVGIIPLFAAGLLDDAKISRLEGFSKRLRWFLDNRQDLAVHIAYLDSAPESGRAPNAPRGHRLLAVPSRERLVSVLRYVLDEAEFLSPYGVRSLSRVHAERPFVLEGAGQRWVVEYVPGESNTAMFGGNSNWRGPVWFPVNYLLVEALHRYHRFYGDSLEVECPTGSGQMMNLGQVADEIARRLVRLFVPDESGHRPCHGGEARYASDPAWRDLILFYEHFHGDDGRGVGASHQTGWTALVATCLEHLAGKPSAAR